MLTESIDYKPVLSPVPVNNSLDVSPNLKKITKSVLEKFAKLNLTTH